MADQIADAMTILRGHARPSKRLAATGRDDHADAKGHAAEELELSAQRDPCRAACPPSSKPRRKLIASATLRVDTPGAGFTEITANAASFVARRAPGKAPCWSICVTPRLR